MADLALLVPSRQRPHNIARLMEAMERTCRADTDLIVGVDDDDLDLPVYESFPCEVVVRSGLQGQLVRWINYLAAPRAERYPYLGHIGDDNVPRTDGWDVDVIESLERQGTGFCFADDLDPGREPGSLSIHAFMTSDVVRKLGYMGPPSIRHMYVDPVWFAWGKATSIEFLSETIIEHLHYSLGKAPRDESYDHSTGLIPADCAAYNVYCRSGLNDDIRKLGGTPFTDEALAAFNAKLNIPKEWA